MKTEIAQRLIALNHQFYTDFGDAFSATRRRIQPGVRRILDSMDGDEKILDLGCGNGELARTLARDGHRGAYLGLDFSLPLLAEADSGLERFSARFSKVDLTSDWAYTIGVETFNVVFCFAALHHIPSIKNRLNIINSVHELLVEDGRFIHSNWQFLNSPRLKERIQKWSEIGFKEAEVDKGDYLLDWRSGGTGLRYVHHFSEDELLELANSSGFKFVESFYSDGKEGNLAIYQTWRKLKP